MRGGGVVRTGAMVAGGLLCRGRTGAATGGVVRTRAGCTPAAPRDFGWAAGGTAFAIPMNVAGVSMGVSLNTKKLTKR